MNTNAYSAHNDISLLLPWYVNHTLHGSELDSVENHLKICLTCRRELASLQKLSVAVNQEGSFDSAALASFSHLKNRIHKTDNPVDPLPEAITNPEHKWYERFDLKLPILARPKLALAAIIVFSLLIPAYVGLGKLVSNDYRTLSDSEISKPSKNEIRVVFSKDANQQQINAILAKVQGQIVAGPTEQSVYTVRINKVSTTKNMLETVEQLKKNTNILFAEPAYDLLSSNQAESDTHL
jgi:hypothetical protein